MRGQNSVAEPGGALSVLLIPYTTGESDESAVFAYRITGLELHLVEYNNTNRSTVSHEKSAMKMNVLTCDHDAELGIGIH